MYRPLSTLSALALLLQSPSSIAEDLRTRSAPGVELTLSLVNQRSRAQIVGRAGRSSSEVLELQVGEGMDACVAVSRDGYFSLWDVIRSPSGQTEWSRLYPGQGSERIRAGARWCLADQGREVYVAQPSSDAEVRVYWAERAADAEPQAQRMRPVPVPSDDSADDGDAPRTAVHTLRYRAR